MSDYNKAVLSLCLSFVFLLITGWFCIKYTGLAVFGKKIEGIVISKEKQGRKASILLNVYYKFNFNKRLYKNYSTIVATDIDKYKLSGKTKVYLLPFYPSLNSVNPPFLYMIIFLMLFSSSFFQFKKHYEEVIN